MTQTAGYVVRSQAVSAGRAAPERVLVAVFPLECGGAACLQLQDEGPLRRGGVYLCARDDADCPGLAPRFEELFADVAHKARDASLRASLEPLLRDAQAAAAATRPRLDPASLAGLRSVAAAAARVDRALSQPAPGAWSVEALVLACTLIFVSEEERYPRPRWKGSAVALDTLLEVLAATAGGPPS